MPDKKREDFIVQKFLDLYNSECGTKYRIVDRPEEHPEMPGTYDFLCEDKEVTANQLAVEEKSLHKSSINVRDNKLVGQLLAEVEARVKVKGNLGGKQWWFYLDFVDPPKRKDRERYIQKLTDIVERTIQVNKEMPVLKPVNLDREGLDCIRSFNLVSTRDSSVGDLHFPFGVQSNESRDVSGDILNALAGIVIGANSSLEIPKREGAKTALVITDYLAFGDGQTFRQAIGSIPLEFHEHIDEAFVVNKNVFDDSYSSYRIK
jgi:hypothetical protein